MDHKIFEGSCARDFPMGIYHHPGLRTLEHSPLEIQKRVQSFPLKLINYYKRITKQLAEHGPKVVAEGRKMLEWASYTERPLTAGEFWDIIAIPACKDRSFMFSAQFFKASKLHTLVDVRKRIRGNCSDLLEIRMQRPSPNRNYMRSIYKGLFDGSGSDQ